MIVLSIATSGDPCSIAVCDDKGLLVERIFRHRMRLSERLVGDVESVLADADTTLEAIDAFVVDLGPGSFTGVRIGVTTVKTWADLLAKPVVGVHALEALAHPFLGQHSDLVVPIIRARPGSVYAAVYSGFQGEELRAPELTTGAELAAALAKWRVKRITLCADGWATADELLGGRAASMRAELALVRPGPTTASTFAAVAWKRLLRGESDQAVELAPLYIAPPPIGTKGKSTQKSNTEPRHSE
jgi:tRNA threonylcarbamoyladenosine biosynthesis protein TsaB